VNIRNWFLFPARATMAVLFAAPLAIVCAYSLLTRGDYGGVEYSWTLENYARLFDPLYGVILWRSFVLAAITTLVCAALGFPLALFNLPLRALQESVAATGDPAVLDQLSCPHLRLAFSIERDRPREHRAHEVWHDPHPSAIALQ